MILRSDITVVCKAMEFGQFPLDKHKCYFILTSCKLSLVYHLSGHLAFHFLSPTGALEEAILCVRVSLFSDNEF